MHHAERWKEYLAWAKTKPRAYFLGMGDYDDLASTSERRILGNTDLHESTFKTLEQLYLSNTKKFAKDTEFMKGRLIGLMGGNHFGMFQNGTTTDQKLCELLSCKYLGVSCFVRLSFISNTKRNTNLAVDIFAHHGRGGGRTPGASMNAVYNMATVGEADIYLMGDNHQKDLMHKNILTLVHGNGDVKLSNRKRLFARTGSFLKGYEEGESSYIVDSLLPPSELGSIKIELTPKRIRRGGDDYAYIDIHASL